MPRARAARRTRLIAGGAVIGCLAAGLSLQLVDRSPAIDLLGSVLYAALIGFAVLLVAPVAPPWVPAAVAFAAAAVIEGLQLTPLPAAISAVVPGAHLVLGSAFDPWDLAAYAVGALVVWVVAHFAR
ncbi:DUF2809 domain-containing protein [Agromyces larvae]|uniref:DUF2809 domain-containing protein n=1 Tax=Agromyces larvae TaxID=2929802 RepID=A0ABY4BW10_9MICO|nr:DUF2809 domain-containing protein [Agromyces larvae]UOE43368.1 DUF2809 domain-containing protein [Agromyces larvae]